MKACENTASRSQRILNSLARRLKSGEHVYSGFTPSSLPLLRRFPLHSPVDVNIRSLGHRTKRYFSCSSQRRAPGHVQSGPFIFGRTLRCVAVTYISFVNLFLLSKLLPSVCLTPSKVLLSPIARNSSNSKAHASTHIGKQGYLKPPSLSSGFLAFVNTL
jgi:hypothetical protein